MTNGCTWPARNDWLIGADKKVRYAPALKRLRRLKSTEWFGKSYENRSKKSCHLTEAITVGQAQEAEENEREHSEDG